MILENTTRKISSSKLTQKGIKTLFGVAVYSGTPSALSWHSREVTTSTWKCVCDSADYPTDPSDIGTGTTCISRRMSAMRNSFYEYEEVWVTEGAWNPDIGTANGVDVELRG